MVVVVVLVVNIVLVVVIIVFVTITLLITLLVIFMPIILGGKTHREGSFQVIVISFNTTYYKIEEIRSVTRYIINKYIILWS